MTIFVLYIFLSSFKLLNCRQIKPLTVAKNPHVDVLIGSIYASKNDKETKLFNNVKRSLLLCDTTL